MTSLPKHITTKDLAASLNCSARTVQRMAAAGEIPAVRVRSEYRFDPQAVEIALSRSQDGPKSRRL